MTQGNSKIRRYIESRKTGKLSDSHWNLLKGRFSNRELKSMSKERINEYIKKYTDYKKP